jgi:crossover junction endodeoxyribonuclease RusA
MVTVTLPYPPSANRIWRNIRGKTLKSEEYRSWLKEASWRISLAKDRLTEGPYGLAIQVGRKDKRRRDLDNFLKPISDALQAGGAVLNDSDCEKLAMRWEPGLDGVRVRVLPTKRRE